MAELLDHRPSAAFTLVASVESARFRQAEHLGSYSIDIVHRHSRRRLPQRRSFRPASRCLAQTAKRSATTLRFEGSSLELQVALRRDIPRRVDDDGHA
jgi:hypothetical protein